MAKRIARKPEWLRAPQVIDIYSVGSCVNDDFADYVDYWKHNGYWLFDSPKVIRNLAAENAIDLEGTSLFYYETYKLESDGAGWRPFTPSHGIPVNVVKPPKPRLEGFDLVSFYCGNAPECCPLSCNSLAERIQTNSHCLNESFKEAERLLDRGEISGCEPGPYRILAVYSVDWP